MIQAVSSAIAKKNRHFIKSGDDRATRWRTDFMGSHGTRSGKIEDLPQAFLIEMDGKSSTGVHFHSVDQFQVLLAGSGSMAGSALPLIAFYYVDHHTVIGPHVAGPYGLSIFTVRTKTDPGAIHVDSNSSGTQKPSKQRCLVTTNISLSTEPVLQNRGNVALESVLEGANGNDGLGAYVLRLGADMKAMGPDPRVTGGQFYLVLNGSLQLDGSSYAAWSTVHVSSADAPFEARAGRQGLEVLILNFPRPDGD